MKQEIEESKPSAEQPLDLSTKKSTPSNSPRPSTVASEPMTSDSEDDMKPIPLNLVSTLPKSVKSSIHSANQ